MKKFTEAAKRETQSINETMDRESKELEKKLNREVNKAVSEERNAPGRVFSTWPVVWMVLGSLVVVWDAAFVLLRPRTLPGGDLAGFFGPYEIYIKVDKPYGDMDDSFTKAQAWLNVAEVVLTWATIFLILRRRPLGLVLGLVVNTMTLWKTVLYMIRYTPCCSDSHANLDHTSLQEALLLFALPSGVWVVFPGLCVWHFFRVLLYLTRHTFRVHLTTKSK